ncbi:MAG: hypothetical protein ACPG4T_21905, partial [Nannocystaceae bacterium]
MPGPLMIRLAVMLTLAVSRPAGVATTQPNVAVGASEVGERVAVAPTAPAGLRVAAGPPTPPGPGEPEQPPQPAPPSSGATTDDRDDEVPDL